LVSGAANGDGAEQSGEGQGGAGVDEHVWLLCTRCAQLIEAAKARRRSREILVNSSS
jgi:hypothetical protein